MKPMILTSLLLAGGCRVQVGSETTTRGLSSGPAAPFTPLRGTNVMILAPAFQSLPTEGGGGWAGGWHGGGWGGGSGHGRDGKVPLGKARP